MAARGGVGFRNPPEHRLPLAGGPVLLVGRGTGPPGLDHAATLAGFGSAGRRPRHALVPTHPGLAGTRHAGLVAGLHAQPVPPQLRGPAFGDPPAVGGPSVADGAHHPGTPDAGMAPCGGLRSGHADRRRRERQLPAPGRHRAGGVVGLVRAGAVSALVAHSRHGRQDGCGIRSYGGLVDGRPGCPGPLRPSDVTPHRELQGCLRCRHRPGALPGPRLLVLLRTGPPRGLDRAGNLLHALGTSPLVRPTPPCPPRGGVGPLPPPWPRPDAHGGRPPRGHWRPSLRRALPPWPALPGVDADRRRAGHSQHPACAPPLDPGDVHAAGCRGGGPGTVASPLGTAADHRALPPDRGQPLAALAGRDAWPTGPAAGGRSRLLARGGSPPGLPGRHDPGPGDTGDRLRRISLGQLW